MCTQIYTQSVYEKNDKMTDTRISVRVTPEEKTHWEDVARREGLSFTALVKEAMELRTNFESLFWENMVYISEKHHLPPYLVIQNKIIRQQAEDSAEDKMTGIKDKILTEFIHTSGGPITGQKLFRMLYINRLTKLKGLRDFVINLKEIAGAPLSELEKAWKENRPKKKKSLSIPIESLDHFFS
jgi:hypothetical protein